MELEDLDGSSTQRVMGGNAFEKVLTSARAGDDQAFAQLYEYMNQRVYAFVSYRGSVDPEAMVNEVFLKVFTNLNTFEGNEVQFAAWIFKIARNKLIDESRFRSRRPEETSLKESHESGRIDSAVESDALATLSTDWVLDQLDVLTPEQRDVVVMRVVSDLTIEVIAEVLGKRVGAVKAMQRRAFRTLARNFDSELVPQ